MNSVQAADSRALLVKIKLYRNRSRITWDAYRCSPNGFGFVCPIFVVTFVF